MTKGTAVFGSYESDNKLVWGLREDVNIYVHNVYTVVLEFSNHLELYLEGGKNFYEYAESFGFSPLPKKGDVCRIFIRNYE